MNGGWRHMLDRDMETFVNAIVHTSLMTCLPAGARVESHLILLGSWQMKSIYDS